MEAQGLTAEQLIGMDLVEVQRLTAADSGVWLEVVGVELPVEAQTALLHAIEEGGHRGLFRLERVLPLDP